MTLVPFTTNMFKVLLDAKLAVYFSAPFKNS